MAVQFNNVILFYNLSYRQEIVNISSRNTMNTRIPTQGLQESESSILFLMLTNIPNGINMGISSKKDAEQWPLAM